MCVLKNEPGWRGQRIKLRSLRKGRRKEAGTVCFLTVVEPQTCIRAVGSRMLQRVYLWVLWGGGVREKRGDAALPNVGPVFWVGLAYGDMALMMTEFLSVFSTYYTAKLLVLQYVLTSHSFNLAEMHNLCTQKTFSSFSFKLVELVF